MGERAVAAVTTGAKKKRVQAGILERRARAFQTYLDVLETAAWFRYQVEPQLSDFDLNLERFQLLEMLYREGPMTTVEAGKRRWCTRQSLFLFAKRVAKSGWLEIERETLPAVEIDEVRLPKQKRSQERIGRRAVTLRLTEKGEKLMAYATRRHAKLVDALMRAINMREMERLSRTCQRVREGDVVKLIKELTMEDVD
ncbi:MAG TPA: hypothetical protein VIY69_12880 [Candidatus Acidoferrales bacterium]